MNEDDAPTYRLEPTGPSGWRVIGPNGPVAEFASEREAQAKADDLNSQIAEEREDDA